MFNTFLYQVDSILPLAEDTSQILLTPQKHAGLSYQSGQYMVVVHANDITSPLSIACAPKKPHTLEFHLYHPEKNLRAQEIMTMATQNKALQLRGPYGACTLDALHLQKSIIFIAFGTGFAPVKSIIEGLISKGLDYPAHFYWFVPRAVDLYLMTFIESCLRDRQNFRFSPIFMRHVESEFIIQRILQDYPDLTSHQIYASGPSALIQNVFEAFQFKGLDREVFFSDVL